MHRLITIPFSHYCEKARWALDRYRVPHQEERYMPMFHFGPMLALSLRRGMGKADRVSSPFSTPLLVTEDGQCIRDSAAILRFVSDRYANGALYPTEEVGELEQRFHDELGPHTRRVAYYLAFGDPELLPRLGDENVGATQARWWRRTAPLMKFGIARFLKVEKATAERSRDKVLAMFAEISERIRGRAYLVGDTFTAADLSFACLAAPALLPSPAEGYGAWLPPAASVPGEGAELVAQLRATEAGSFALRMFATERGR
ncbi:MAG: glutathione S-transferase family protein [Myxococcales bacterium]|nr:glutathione S-transferase family protein [Myxococcales bacterium]